jgi:uncharacterized protein YaiI (UPF0178 family)
MVANINNLSLKIIVDADACPVKDDIIEIAKDFVVKVILIASINHFSTQVYEGVEFIYVDAHSQAADLAICNKVTAGDLVVTQDYGLAALVLSKRGIPISPRGKIFSEQNIEELLEQRHISAKLRRGGVRTKGPSPFTQEDRKTFREALRKFLA